MISMCFYEGKRLTNFGELNGGVNTVWVTSGALNRHGAKIQRIKAHLETSVRETPGELVS